MMLAIRSAAMPCLFFVSGSFATVTVHTAARTDVEDAPYSIGVDRVTVRLERVGKTQTTALQKVLDACGDVLHNRHERRGQVMGVHDCRDAAAAKIDGLKQISSPAGE